MNLEKLFETQKVLRNRINYDGADRFEKLILALLVELGECANEWRGFKFWSKDQKPRTEKKVICHACKGLGEFHQQIFSGNEHVDDTVEICTYCVGTGYQEDKNPLLEEYVDGLHFVLELGIEIKQEPSNVQPFCYENILKQFNGLYWEVSVMETKDRGKFLRREMNA